MVGPSDFSRTFCAFSTPPSAEVTASSVTEENSSQQALLHIGGEELDLGHLGHDLLHLPVVEGGEDGGRFLRAEHDEQGGEFLDFVQARDRARFVGAVAVAGMGVLLV